MLSGPRGEDVRRLVDFLIECVLITVKDVIGVVVIASTVGGVVVGLVSAIDFLIRIF